MSTNLLREMPAAYGRHQTFTIRYTWLKVGYEAVLEDTGLFSSEFAHRELGVGKNMARSIRFWLQAAGLCVEQDSRMTPTAFGRFLLADDGLDPYLEAASSWWLLHWKLVSPQSHLPAWWTAFHAFPAVTFDVDALVEYVGHQVSAVGKPAPASTLRRDILALVRNYSGTTDSRREKADDRIDLPFAQLGLIRPSGSRVYRFLSGPKPSLAAATVLFATLDFLAATDQMADTLLVGALAHDAGGPGRAFQLTERDLVALYREAAGNTKGVRVITANGADQLVVEGDRERLAVQVLASLYQSLGLTVRPHKPTEPLLSSTHAMEPGGVGHG